MKENLFSHRWKQWKNIPLLPLFGFALLFLSLSGCMPIKRQKETYATFLEYSAFASGGDSYWEFYDNGKRYTVFSWKPFNEIRGEKYVILYDSLKPGKHYAILRSRPVFAADEATGRTTCTVTQDACVTPKEAGGVEFNYVVDFKTYSNSNGVPARMNDTICLKKGDQFEVEYWLENPQRSIIHLDKPM